uniref:Uncharacterized protein n=1 Tax=Zea mays TaxID=4577 RepID=A0A804REJ6_MAIZE
MGQRWQSPRQRGHRPGRRRSRSRVYVQLWGLKFPPANFRAGQDMQAPVVLGNVTDRTCCHFNYNSTWASACVDAYIGTMQETRQQKDVEKETNEIARLGFIKTSSSQKVGRGEQKTVLGQRSKITATMWQQSSGSMAGTNDLQRMEMIRLARGAASRMTTPRSKEASQLPEVSLLQLRSGERLLIPAWEEVLKEFGHSSDPDERGRLSWLYGRVGHIIKLGREGDDLQCTRHLGWPWRLRPPRTTSSLFVYDGTRAARSIMEAGGEWRVDGVPHGERMSSILIYAEGRTRTTARASFFLFLCFSLPNLLL